MRVREEEMRVRKEQRAEEQRAEDRDTAILRLAVMLFSVSSAGPKPHTPHTAFQQATAFLEEATKKFGEKASRRIF